MQLLDDADLEQSGIIANCRMNRERGLIGSNGYAVEIGFNPLDLLKSRLTRSSRVNWLDLCCGTGNALIEAALAVQVDGLQDRIEIVGVDLVPMFSQVPPGLECLRLVSASLNSWRPDCHFDLITCVHGLHYIGDKLRLVADAAGWLAG